MSFTITLNAEVQGPGVWKAIISPSDVKRIAVPFMEDGDVTIIGLKSADHRGPKLTFGVADATVLNAGKSDRAILIQTTQSGGIAERAAKMGQPSKKETSKSQGDASFVQACRVLLHNELAEQAAQLLDSIRVRYPGELVEGQFRKWVNSPANFFAFTIQNRDQSLAVYVRGEPEKHPETRLEIKRDRPGYSRFKVAHAEQFKAALPIILGAASLGRQS